MTVRHIMGEPVGSATYTLAEAIENDLVIPAVCGELFRPSDSILNHVSIDPCNSCGIGVRSERRRDSKRGQHRTSLDERREFPHYVYRCFDAKDRLLYVGCTYNPPARMRQHRAEKRAWVDKVVRTRLTVWPDRRKALDMERRAIETEGPIHNKAFNRESA